MLPILPKLTRRTITKIARFVWIGGKRQTSLREQKTYPFVNVKHAKIGRYCYSKFKGWKVLPPSPLNVWWSIKYHAKGRELSHSSLITDDKERNKIYPQVQSSHWFRSLMFGLKTFTLPSSVTAKRIYENTESLQFQSEPQIKKIVK